MIWTCEDAIVDMHACQLASSLRGVQVINDKDDDDRLLKSLCKTMKRGKLTLCDLFRDCLMPCMISFPDITQIAAKLSNVSTAKVIAIEKFFQSSVD